jgi:hypothetical protein
MKKITGIAMTCGDAPVQHGYVRISNGSEYYTVPIDNPQGNFSTTLLSQLTEAGGIGEFVRGNFRGKITAGDNGAGGPEYSDFAGTFAIIRAH